MACPEIVGTWQSSKELSMAYNIEKAQLTSKNTQFLNQALGILKVTYSATEMLSHSAPAIKMKIDGKTYPFVFEQSVVPYKILSCSDSAVTIIQNQVDSGPSTVKLTFIDANTYWVSPEPLPSIREYFRRVAN